MLYEIVKALHIIVVITWFAGLFYLPRLYVYHTTATPESHDMLCTMERKLMKIIMWPSLILVWIFGITLIALNPGWLQMGWLHTKLLLVILLTLYHVSLEHFRRQFLNNQNTRPERFFRIYNELPALILIAVIFLVVLKPF